MMISSRVMTPSKSWASSSMLAKGLADLTPRLVVVALGNVTLMIDSQTSARLKDSPWEAASIPIIAPNVVRVNSNRFSGVLRIQPSIR